MHPFTPRHCIRFQSKIKEDLQLNIIIKESNLLARLERRHADIRTAIAAERISQTAVPARSNLSFDSEIDFC
jgi:hypothetical protein